MLNIDETVLSTTLVSPGRPAVCRDDRFCDIGLARGQQKAGSASLK